MFKVICWIIDYNYVLAHKSCLAAFLLQGLFCILFNFLPINSYKLVVGHEPVKSVKEFSFLHFELNIDGITLHFWGCILCLICFFPLLLLLRFVHELLCIALLHSFSLMFSTLYYEHVPQFMSICASINNLVDVFWCPHAKIYLMYLPNNRVAIGYGYPIDNVPSFLQMVVPTVYEMSVASCSPPVFDIVRL